MTPEPSPAPEPRRITYETIAQVAGYSKMTVSKAFRNHPSIPPATREKIFAAAQRLGYRPNPLVSAFMASLRQNRAPLAAANLVYLDAHRTADEVVNTHSLRRLREGAHGRARELGYNLVELYIGEQNLSPARITSILRAQNVVGIVVAPLAYLEQRIELEWGEFSCAALGHSFQLHALHRSASHQFYGVNLALEKLRAKGYRRIGLAAAAEMDQRMGHVWSGAFARHILAAPPEQRVEMHLPTGGITSEPLAAWLRSERPDAILTYPGANIWHVRSAGLRVPDDLAFVCLGCEEEAPGQSGIRQNLEAVGAAGVDLVVNQLYRNERGLPKHPQSVLICGEWVEGETA